MSRAIDLVEELRAAGCVFAEDEAAAIRRAGLDDAGLERVVAGRRAGLPLEHVLGTARVGELDLEVPAGAFVPRQRTAVLAARTVAEARRRGAAPLVVELCCGVAPVAAAVRRDLPGAVVLAADADPRVLDAAARNAPGATVVAGDLWDALPATARGRVDVVAAVPPYVPTDEVARMPPEAREHEPRAALDGGPDGLGPARRILRAAGPWLAPGAALLLEVNERQAALLHACAEAVGLRPRRVDVVAGTTTVVTLGAGA